jgi:D-serine deaminase-like pyridoxal phosphate-dependent protein
MTEPNDLDTVATPIPVVHLDLLEANLTSWADAIAAHGARLRPHAKTHKTVEVARMQLERGAAGLTVAKPSEGLALLPSGVTDVFVAYPIVGSAKIAQLLALAREVRVSSSIDDLGAATALSDAALDAGTVLEVLVDVDTGLRRTGLAPEEAVELGVSAASLPGLRVMGVFSYAGYPSTRPEAEERRAWSHQEARTSVEVADALRERGLEIDTVSVAGTPTARYAAEIAGITEVRPGIYAFGDANYSRIGAVGVEECALRILATVVSRPSAGRAVVDAGTKALAADEGLDSTYGYLPAHPQARLTRVWEEHGVLELSLDEGSGRAGLAIGDRVEIVPNHVCPAVNLAPHLLCVENGEVTGSWEVVAR